MCGCVVAVDDLDFSTGTATAVSVVSYDEGARGSAGLESIDLSACKECLRVKKTGVYSMCVWVEFRSE